MTSHKPRRRFGQNFLQSKEILQKIANAIPSHIPRESAILEIGPGQGALTDELLANGHTVYAIEIDRDLVALLSKKYAKLLLKRFFILESDVLAVDLHAFCKEHAIEHVIGNLPYNISTPFMLKLEQACPHLTSTFLVQKEVADRLCAPAGNRDYGRLSLAVQHSFHVTSVCHVPPESFYPAPKVQSQVISLSPRENRMIKSENFQLVVDVAFQQRRKTLRNALSQWSIDFTSLGIDPSRRPETLSETEFNQIALAIGAPTQAE